MKALTYKNLCNRMEKDYFCNNKYDEVFFIESLSSSILEDYFNDQFKRARFSLKLFKILALLLLLGGVALVIFLNINYPHLFDSLAVGLLFAIGFVFYFVIVRFAYPFLKDKEEETILDIRKRLENKVLETHFEDLYSISGRSSSIFKDALYKALNLSVNEKDLEAFLFGHISKRIKVILEKQKQKLAKRKLEIADTINYNLNEGQ